jgi:hypothetical protein
MQIQAVAAAELLKRQRTLQDSSQVADALSKLPNKECSDSDCLAQLARDTNSDCTAYFAVTPNAGRSVFLSARLIPASAPDRPVFSRSEHYDRVGKTPRDWSISALQRFIRTVPLAKEVAAIEITPLPPKSDGSNPPPNGQTTTNPNPPNLNPPTKPTPDATSMSAPHSSGPNWRTTVGGGLSAVGVGATIAGVVIRNRAEEDWKNVLDSANGAPFEHGRTQEVLDAYRSARGKMSLGTVGIIGGAGFAVAGAGLLVWELLSMPKDAPASPSSKVACSPSAGGMRCAFTFP